MQRTLTLTLVLSVLRLQLVIACSTTTFISTYEAYPECAASCLGCGDSSYSRNFANNCNYESGACCTSKYHDIIAETWSCVEGSCGDKVSREAFSTFVEFCKDKHNELQEKDMMLMLRVADKSHKPPLSAGQIIGISFGAVTCTATVIGLILRWIHYRHKKDCSKGDFGDCNGTQLIHQAQPTQVGAVINAVVSDPCTNLS
ncbi:hypothetical protein B0T10DRAFT_565602 [Thelonectria olida]|uniref:Extracellular membrane protein CFEM domain-containing protein n=1 Tax=Thelonectria olida TaxID=1576542 RepID=A0A9P8VVV1_9HYPO|nr:hypothetical protein B0T10DRAFT_565602 [Thelonectria olida]